MTVLIVQCRLSSTRLPRKGLKDLGGKPVLAWVLASMKKVKADAYYVATDEDSAPELEGVVKSAGWNIFVGPKNDVLERFCLLINKIKADVVIRATADNPFLFYEAAQALEEEYFRCSSIETCDYITWTGLPHGSGIEIFNAHSLLKAKELTSDPYDHEHVGPALYNHKDSYASFFKPAPSRWNHPDLRTTIDTPSDFIRAQLIIKNVSMGKAPSEPYTTEQILSALEKNSIKNMILFVPSVKKGHGTGHLRRCLSLAVYSGGAVFIPENSDLSEKDEVIEEFFSQGLSPYQIIQRLPEPNEFSVIVTDSFVIEKTLVSSLYKLAPVISLDEGSSNKQFCDYLLNIIPGIKKIDEQNRFEPKFIAMPQNKRNKPRPADFSQIQNVLVCAGGEDPANLVVPSATAFAELGKNVTAIKPGITKAVFPSELAEKITLCEPIPNLREKLYEYDLVVTHYGLTAWESVAAGCAVLLLGTTPLHVALAKKYGFACFKDNNINIASIKKTLLNFESLYPEKAIFLTSQRDETLNQFVANLSGGKRLPCPVCESPSTGHDPVVARTSTCTFRRCASCGMLYVSYTINPDMAYTQSYFFDQYKNQYGKTYLEDFSAIKSQCIRRMSVIDFMYHRKGNTSVAPSILDIGCAYGPFLSAAADSGWQVFGTDVSKDAVNYVQRKLKFPASCAAFPDFNPSVEFGVLSFDAVTMWYVIEHFKNLADVLKTVNEVLKPGGIFAFSTPCASGISGRFNSGSFFAQSPIDHYTLWETKRAKLILNKFGFKVVRIISTGHHPERFPLVKKYGWKKGSIPYTLLAIMSRFFNLGDTFEVYCKKIAK